MSRKKNNYLFFLSKSVPLEALFHNTIPKISFSDIEIVFYKAFSSE